MTATALLDQLIMEGTDQLDYPGVIFRGPAHDRRAALAAGPDVWEVVARLQELEGSEEHRISSWPLSRIFFPDPYLGHHWPRTD
jgi:hypothetical protein